MGVNENRFYKELSCFHFISIRGIKKKRKKERKKKHYFQSCILLRIIFFMRRMMEVSTADEDE